MEKLVRKVQCTYTETDELRKIYVKDLEGIPDIAVKAMDRIRCSPLVMS